ncbi:MAG: hypothetical protein JOZ56_08565 [Actinobacteria bacterium]|nr:hypothetical protein [Actinomycetota bacterium]MBV8563129.1 hypothetical protein [Actinomycetota bacterium]
MRRTVENLEAVSAASVGLAALCALAGYLIGHIASGTSATHAIGWGMCIGGAVAGLVGGQSGSPSRLGTRGVLQFLGNYWGSTLRLPAPSFAVPLAGMLVLAGGIALFVLAG